MTAELSAVQILVIHLANQEVIANLANAKEISVDSTAGTVLAALHIIYTLNK